MCQQLLFIQHYIYILYACNHCEGHAIESKCILLEPVMHLNNSIGVKICKIKSHILLVFIL